MTAPLKYVATTETAAVKPADIALLKAIDLAIVALATKPAEVVNAMQGERTVGEWAGLPDSGAYKTDAGEYADKSWTEYKKYLQSKPDKERRELAMKWWWECSHHIQVHYAQRYFKRNASHLTGREIQMIHEGDKLFTPKPSEVTEEMINDIWNECTEPMTFGNNRLFIMTRESFEKAIKELYKNK